MLKSIRLLPLSLIFGATLAGAAVLPSEAHRFANGQCIYGEPVANEAGARVVDVSAGNHLNVRYGETLRFVNGGKAFSWRFNGLDRRALDLQAIAPADFGAKPLELHVGRDPYGRR